MLGEVLSMHRASLIEGYMHADCYLAVRHRSIGPSQYRFLIIAMPVGGLGELDRATGKAIEPNPSGKDKSIEQPPMLSCEVQIMEGTQQGKSIRSGVWLQSPDSVFVELGEPVYLFQRGIKELTIGILSRWRQKLSLTFPDGEICAAGASVVPDSQGGRHQVEAAADTVNNRARLSIDDGVESLDIVEAIKLFSGVRLGVWADHVGFVVPPLSDTILQNWELGHGPLDCSFSV